MNWLQKCRSDANKLPKEKGQKFVDQILKGKTLGEASDEAGITFDEANGIMNMNIKSAYWLDPRFD